MKNCIIISIFFSLFSLPLTGENFYIEEYGYSIYIPEAWEVLDSSDMSKLSFRSDDQTVVSQISTFDGQTYNSAAEMYEDLTKDFRIESEGSHFLYNGDKSYLADISFNDGQNLLRGWFLFINRDDRDYFLFSFSGEEFYQEKLPFILSVLDSFRIENDDKSLFPGAVSQFYYPFPGNDKDTAQMVINGDIVSFQTDINEFEASQLVIEREASMMEYYQKVGDKPLFEKAWKRYYKVIFRDNYSRFINIAESLRNSKTGTNNRETAVILLNWIQNFEYASSETFSDLLSPLASVSLEKGDCDARGLAYSILLKHFNIDSLLMVSWQYQHSMSAVDVPGDGARYPYNDTSYLIAETTEVVDIGMIPQSMADGEKWIPVSFNDL
jgi:hypothetical protein